MLSACGSAPDRTMRAAEDLAVAPQKTAAPEGGASLQGRVPAPWLAKP